MKRGRKEISPRERVGRTNLTGSHQRGFLRVGKEEEKVTKGGGGDNQKLGCTKNS